ncbi:MAG: putative toxin-antitoxin system toxin component, PIN family [Bryobacterales bacterium]|nr:putative toxin-antitoxin system toxin component, PIN family [Bryobacterales bacterium]MDE0623564.1 putative toxin-antitoxin system toxin component, PIN family [Bryobacterales bacterium]
MRRVVVDTSVLVSAVLSPDGAAREVVRQCLLAQARPLVSNALFLEYEEVLARDELFAEALITSEDRAVLLDAFLSVCEWVSITFLWRPNLPDESDNHLIELAVAGHAGLVITGNTKDISGGELIFDTIRIVTPSAWLKEGD